MTQCVLFAPARVRPIGLCPTSLDRHRIFDYVSAKHFDEKRNHGIALKDKHFRVRNNNDIIARVPPFPYEHVGTEIYLDRL